MRTRFQTRFLMKNQLRLSPGTVLIRPVFLVLRSSDTASPFYTTLQDSTLWVHDGFLRHEMDASFRRSRLVRDTAGPSHQQLQRLAS